MEKPSPYSNDGPALLSGPHSPSTSRPASSSRSLQVKPTNLKPWYSKSISPEVRSDQSKPSRCFSSQALSVFVGHVKGVAPRKPLKPPNCAC